MNHKIQELVLENKQLKEENKELKEENMEYKIKMEKLEQNYTNKKWYIHGGMRIDIKLQKGCSTNYKTNALTLFAENYKKSYTPEQEQEAIEQGVKFRVDSDLKNRNGLFSFVGQSESSQLVDEFLKNVTINN